MFVVCHNSYLSSLPTVCPHQGRCLHALETSMLHMHRSTICLFSVGCRMTARSVNRGCYPKRPRLTQPALCSTCRALGRSVAPRLRQRACSPLQQFSSFKGSHSSPCRQPPSPAVPPPARASSLGTRRPASTRRCGRRWTPPPRQPSRRVFAILKRSLSCTPRIFI